MRSSFLTGGGADVVVVLTFSDSEVDSDRAMKEALEAPGRATKLRIEERPSIVTGELGLLRYTNKAMSRGERRQGCTAPAQQSAVILMLMAMEARPKEKREDGSFPLEMESFWFGWNLERQKQADGNDDAPNKNIWTIVHW